MENRDWGLGCELVVLGTDSAVLVCGVTEVFWERIFLKNALDSSQCLHIWREFILWYLCMSEPPKLQNQWVYACIKRKNANQNWKKLKILFVSPISRKYKGNPWNFMRALWNYSYDAILYLCRWLGYRKVSIFPVKTTGILSKRIITIILTGASGPPKGASRTMYF